MISIETRTPSFGSTKALSPPSRAPGYKAGGGTGRFPSFEIPKTPFSSKTKSFESTKLHPSLKLENKLIKSKTENIKAKSAFETIKPLKVEAKAPDIKPSKPKGSERFAQLGNTSEYRINRTIDPLDRQIPKAEVQGMKKVVEAPNVHKPTEAKVPDIIKQAFAEKPESFLDPTKNNETRKLNQLPKGKERFHKSSEVLKRMSETKNAPTAETKPLTEAIADSIKNTKRAEFASLLKDHKVTLIDAVKKDIARKVENNVPEQAKINPRSELIKNILKDKNALTEVYEKSNPEKTAPELKTKTPNQNRREFIANLLTSQKVSLAEITKISDIPKQTESITTKSISTKTIEQNLEVVKQVLAQNKQNPEQQVNQKVLTELMQSPNVVNFQQAKELIEKQNEIQKVEPIVIENPAEAVKILEQAKQQIETKADQTVVHQPHIEASIKILQQPEKVNIDPEKRTEAIELLQELISTKEYAANPQLQEQIKLVVKTEQKRVTEEAEMVKTAQYLIEMGAEQEVVAERLQAVVETKKLPMTEEQIAVLIEKAEAKIQEFPKLITENGELIEEEEDEYELIMKKLQLLLIELDEHKLDKRLEFFFKALEKTWIQKYEEGREKANGSEIIANVENPEPKVLESSIIGPDQTDGSLVEATKDIEKMGSFDNLDQARQALTNILINHLPGKVTNQPSSQVLSEQQVKEILQGGAYPSQMGKLAVIN